MDNFRSASLSSEKKKIKKFSTLKLNNDNKAPNLNRIISMRNIKKNKIFTGRSEKSTKNIKRVINLLMSDFSENHMQKMLKNEKLIPFEDYNKKIDKNLLDYKVIQIDEKLILKKKPLRESILKGKTKNKENTKEKSLSRNKSEPYYKVTVQDLNFYKNPNESLTAINNNNEIFNEINKDSLARQRILFDNNIKIFEKYSSKFRVKMPKIKVFNSSTKIPAEMPVINLMKKEDDYKNNEESLNNNLQNSDEIKLFYYYKYSAKNFPEGKEQFGLCSKGKYLFLSGGLSTNMKKMNIWALNMETLEWNKLPLKNLSYCRYGHTSVYYQNKIYFYGGIAKIENIKMLAGLGIFSLNDKSFIVSDTKGEPSKRKNHIAEIVGNSMFIHGGIDEENQVLDDCYLLNLQQLKWSVPMIINNNKSPKVYGHSSCLVVPDNIIASNAFNIYKFPDTDYLSKKNKKNIIRGIYIFGGKSKEINSLNNNLWILLIGQEPLQWIKAETKGIQPSPRYYHSMNFFEKARYIIIHGGRNDELSSSCALNDTFILDLISLNWINVSLFSNYSNFKVISRFSHNSSIYGNKLIIFGGMNNNNYIGSSLFIINLEANNIANINFLINSKRTMKDNSEEFKRMQQKLEKELQKHEMGNISNINLPPIK